MQFQLSVHKNDKDRVTITYAVEACQCHVHTSRDGCLPTFIIKIAHHAHTCGRGINTTSHPRALNKSDSRQVIMKL